MRPRQPTAKSGFSLLELALVVIIIGLILGGIAVGRGLIKSSQLQAVAGEYARYVAAVKAFQEKYLEMPGDFAAATDIWGALNNTPANCITIASPNTVGTCNGDGNGTITTQSGGAYATTYYEQFRAWQHLANAGLISGSYSGVSTSGTYRYTIGTNIPSSAMGGGGWRLIHYTPVDQALGVAGLPALTAGDIPYNLVLWFGGAYVGDSNLMGSIISPSDAFDLDTKLDDGRPNTGKLVSQSNTAPINCATGDVYNQNDNDACALVFKTGL